jgi:hypothetical protein
VSRARAGQQHHHGESVILAECIVDGFTVHLIVRGSERDQRTVAKLAESLAATIDAALPGALQAARA